MTYAAGALSFVRSTSISIFPTAITMRLNCNNFVMWKTQVIPNISAQGLLGYLDDSCPSPLKTITARTDDAAVTTTTPAYTLWLHMVHLVLKLAHYCDR
jgi:hypothetical protein